MDLVPDIPKYTFIKQRNTLTLAMHSLQTHFQQVKYTNHHAEQSTTEMADKEHHTAMGVNVNKLQSNQVQLPFHHSSAYWEAGGGTGQGTKLQSHLPIDCHQVCRAFGKHPSSRNCTHMNGTPPNCLLQGCTKLQGDSSTKNPRENLKILVFHVLGVDKCDKTFHGKVSAEWQNHSIPNTNFESSLGFCIFCLGTTDRCRACSLRWSYFNCCSYNFIKVLPHCKYQKSLLPDMS